MYTCKFYISKDFICLIVIIYIVFGFRQTRPRALHLSGGGPDWGVTMYTKKMR